jgi:hypothetical protein
MNATTRTDDRRDAPDDGGRVQTLWHWIAVGTLLFCWIAEASMCGQRGF